METTIRTRYSKHAPVNAPIGKGGRVKQSFKAECDINNIVNQAMRTGMLPQLDGQPQYGDFTQAVSYHEAQNIVLLANEQFANLSAKVRERFQNNPQAFLDFATNPANQKEMVSLGLATERQPEPTSPKSEAKAKTDSKSE